MYVVFSYIVFDVLFSESTVGNKKAQWYLESTISPLSTPASESSVKRRKCFIDDPTDFPNIYKFQIWDLKELSMAGKLLRKPPLPCSFADEHETRRVYSMIYDVYRRKFINRNIL